MESTNQHPSPPRLEVQTGEAGRPRETKARQHWKVLLGWAFERLMAAGAAAAIWFLVRSPRSNDERERQINYRALTFAFTGTLIFSRAIGFLQSFGFHSVSWLGIPVLMIILCCIPGGIDEDRLRVLRSEKEWSQAELAAQVGVACGTTNAIETGSTTQVCHLPLARAFCKTVERPDLENESFIYMLL